MQQKTGNLLCIVQIRRLQFSSHGHSQLCNSTDADSPKYCCTPHSQSTTPSKLHTSPTATPLAPNLWTNKIQNWLHVLQRNHRFRSLFLSYYTFTVLPALSALRQTRAWSKSNDSTAKPMAYVISHFGPHIWNNQDIRHSATLSSFKSQLKAFFFSEYFS